MTVVKRKRRNLVPAFLLLLAFLLGTACSGIGTGIRSHTSSSSWTFAVIADTQGDGSPQIDGKSCINDTVLRAIAEDISREKPDFVLVAGDLVNGWFRNGGTGYAIQYENWRKAMAPVYHAGIRVYPIRGNHDSGPERLALPPLPSHLEPPPDTPVALKKAFQNAFSESYIPKNGPVDEAGLTYSFPHKNAFIVGLDQFTGGQHKVNQAWLDGQLAVGISFLRRWFSHCRNPPSVTARTFFSHSNRVWTQFDASDSAHCRRHQRGSCVGCH
ncbi:MAG TPA: metallophosphoesterase [Syntrophales bacterium]|mgnify:CR=1 FL=1|nr:metallophosphoesterase [Syntrophales bacterium]